MNPIPELITLLKQLRLSGILDSLEARNREAVDDQLAYTDFLGLLVLDEVARRDRKKLDQRLRRANFRNQKTLEGFDFGHLPNLNRSAVHDLGDLPVRRGKGRRADRRALRHRQKPLGAGHRPLRRPARPRRAVQNPKPVDRQPARSPGRRQLRPALAGAWSRRRCPSSTTSG